MERAPYERSFFMSPRVQQISNIKPNFAGAIQNIKPNLNSAPIEDITTVYTETRTINVGNIFPWGLVDLTYPISFTFTGQRL